MSRRDTIIVALLANVCLLALLFVLADYTDDGGNEPISYATPTMNPATTTELVHAEALAHRSAIDEIDTFLKELPKEEIGQPILVDEDGYVELDKLDLVTLTKPVESSKPVVAKPSPTPAPAPTAPASTSSPSPTPSSTDSDYVTITVKSGDALERIARNNGTTVEAIKKANNLSSNKLAIGQVLRIPLVKNSFSSTAEAIKPTQIAVKETEKTVVVNAEVKYYIVKNGDSLWKIARDQQVKAEDIMRLNGLSEESARNLKIGDKIRIR